MTTLPTVTWTSGAGTVLSYQSLDLAKMKLELEDMAKVRVMVKNKINDKFLICYVKTLHKLVEIYIVINIPYRMVSTCIYKTLYLI